MNWVLSDHVPLVANLPLSAPKTHIPVLANTQSSVQSPPKVLFCPLSEFDRTVFAQSLQDPAHGVLQKLEGVLQTLDPAHTEAITFLNNLNCTSAKHTRKLEIPCNKPATEAAETLAEGISGLIDSSYQVALKVCSTKLMSSDNKQYNPRTVSNRRRNLKKKLSLIRFVQSLLISLDINQKDSASTILQQNKENQTLHTAISKLNSLKHDFPPLHQLEGCLTAQNKLLGHSMSYVDETSVPPPPLGLCGGALPFR
eukprot:1103088-Pelagomonas_calceolata.AAC.2